MSCYNFHIYDLHSQNFPKLFLLKMICYTNSIYIYYAPLIHELNGCGFVNQFHEKMIFHMPGNDAAFDDFDFAFSNPLTKEIFVTYMTFMIRFVLYKNAWMKQNSCQMHHIKILLEFRQMIKCVF